MGLGGAAALGFVLLAAHAHTVAADPYGGAPLFGSGSGVARADTDTVATDTTGRPPLPPLDSLAGDPFPDDSLGTDSLTTDSLGTAAADSLADDLTLRDSLDADSLGAEMLEDTLPEAIVEADADTFRLAPLYFPTPRHEPLLAPLADRPERPFQLPFGAYWQREVALDSSDFAYAATERVGAQDVRVQADADLAAYRDARRDAGAEAAFRELASRRGRRAGPGGVGVTFEIPGGNQSAIADIFGTGEVDLRVNGQANIDLGFDYQTNELQEAATGQAGSLNPDFGQELLLGITGTIGDKLQINVNYDTQNQFDFENQVSLVYDGYDDDIIQRIEAGNVFLQTPSELIRGGQRLFGLRTDLRFGGLGLTAVASQQDAESDALEIEGGTQTTAFSLAPYEYEDNTHFFIGYAFRNWWDEGHADPTRTTLQPGFQQIISLEVWLHDAAAINSGPGGEGAETRSDVIALVDLNEPVGVLEGGDAYLALYADDPGVTPLPDSLIDQYTEADLIDFRTAETVDFQAFDLDAADYAEAPFRRLIEGVDYTYDPYLGYVSLKRALTAEERIAVAYQYRNQNSDPSANVVSVGDYGLGASGSNERIVLKLLRSKNPTPNDASWALTMRNIYRVGGRSLTPDAFDADITYQPEGRTAQRTLPGVQIGQQQTLLRTFGLDRLNRDDALQPDEVFDFRPGISLDPSAGRIIFPVREPFGDYLRRVFQGEEVFQGQPPVTVNFQGTALEDALETFVFDVLYDLPPGTAELQFPRLSNYAIAGEYRSSVQSLYELGFAVVEGSVRVTAGSIELTENQDYIVNYPSGTVEITNAAYLSPGQNIRVEYERNQFVSIGSKTLLGLRADYTLGERLALGATWMRLSERPLIDKYRIGEEPLSNTIFGVDGYYEAEPRWVTRVLDALPLLTTRAPSRFEFKGEFAQLSPGHPETFAFETERDALQNIPAEFGGPRDFKEDELRGLSFVDDFEGVENVYSLLAPGQWRLAAAPARADSSGSGPGPANAEPWNSNRPITDPLIPTNWRGLFGWYAVQQNLYDSDLCEAEVDCTTPATQEVFTEDLFPEREVGQNQPRTLTPLDLYFDPRQRGPYNYNGALQTTFADNPQDAWSGLVQQLPDGYTDFSGRNNIEFVEFIFRPLGGRDGTEPVAPGAVLYLDLGQVSEDVIPNNRFNSEDGLTNTDDSGFFDVWGRLPDGQPFNTVDLDEATNRTEDLGLDGLRSTAQNPDGEPYANGERDYFAEFVDALAGGSAARFVAEEDASADDYHHFEETGYFNDGNRFEGGRATLQERFTRFFPGFEFNAFESQSNLTDSGQPGNSRFPDTEDLDGSSGLDNVESHWRYAIPLDADGLRNSPFFQNTIETLSGQTWYLMRVPVRSEARQAVGNIRDFTLVESIRLWTEGHDKPATLRFASLELVGSQWLKSERVGLQEGSQGTGTGPRPVTGNARLFIETINNEENSDYAIPSGTLVSRTRDIGGGLTPSREQALVFRVENLPEGAARAIYKPFSTNRLDLTKYGNLRMFVHAEGFERRDSVRVFLRLGANETEDYYEIEQPVYPFASEAALALAPEVRADSLWQTNVPVAGGGEVDLNAINILLSELNLLKAERDEDPAIPLDEPYTSARTPEGAPPGTRIRIRGNPSIQSIATIALGVRNGDGGTTAPLPNVELWFNELRATGYDEQSGWSAYARTTLQLADFATVNARFAQQTDGFGELGSGLGDRAFQDDRDLSVQATVNAHKLLPERFGWNVPLSFSLTQNESTPRFSPQRGDLRVDELVAQVEENPDLSPEDKAQQVAAIREESQTAAYTRSIRVPISKTGSRSPWLRYTLDGFSVVYTNTASSNRNPSTRFSDAERWTGSVAYRLAVPRPQTIRPFWLIDDFPLLGGLLGGLRLNYLPQSFTFTADADRSITANQERPDAFADSALAEVPDRFLYPVRRDQTFGHGRAFDLAYNPFTFLSLLYRSDVTQSLTAAGANETFELFVRDDSTGLVREYALTQEEAFAPGGPARGDFGIPDTLSFSEATQGLTIYQNRTLDVLPAGEALSNALSGERRVLTDNYGQNISATLTPRLDQYRWLNWFRPQPLSYSTQFSWSNTPLQGISEDTTVAGVSSNASIRGGLQLRPRELWRLFPFYRRLEAADGQGAQAAPGQRPGQEDEGAAADSTGDGRTGFRLPSPLVVARRLFLAATGIEDFSVTYTGSRTASAGGLLGEGYSLLSALTGSGIPFDYRLALDRRINLDRRLNNELIQSLQDNIGDNHRFNARTTVRLTPDFLVNLTWDTNWNETNNFTYQPSDGGLLEQPSTQRGGGESTVLAFGASYDRLFEAFRARYEADLQAGRLDPSGDYLLTDIATTEGVTDLFRNTLVRGMGAFGANSFFALPLPNWTVTYSALNRLPLLRLLSQQASLRHNYYATYNLSYSSNAQAGNLTPPRPLFPTGDGGTVTIAGEIPFLEPGTVTLTERLQPLVGLDVTWKGGIQTQLDWNQSATYSLAAATSSVDRQNTDEVSLRVSLSTNGLRLPFMRRRTLNNALRFTLTLARTDNEDFAPRYLLTDLERTLTGQALPEEQVNSSRRLTVEPRLSYTLSNQVSVDAFVRYESVESQGSQIPSTSDLTGGFAFRVSFSN